MSEHIEVDFPYIRAWSFVHSGNAITVSVTLETAREDGAPVDSVFQELPSGRWIRITDITDVSCVAAVREHAARYRRFKPGHEPVASAHPRPQRGTQIGRKGEIALLLVAEAGGEHVALRDLPARERHYLNSKAGVLRNAALLTTAYGDAADGGEPDRHSLTALGRDLVDHLRAAGRS